MHDRDVGGQSVPIIAQQAIPDLTAWLIGTPVTVLAAVTWAWLTGRIVTGAELQRCQAKLDDALAELRRIAREDRDVLVPTLVRATDVLANYVQKRAGDTPPPPPRSSRRA